MFNNRLNRRLLNASCWIQFLLTVILPGTYIAGTPGKIEFGFPIHHFAFYDYPRDTNWFFNAASLNVGTLSINIVITFLLLFVIVKIKDLAVKKHSMHKVPDA